MKFISRNESHSFGPFDLTKIPKYDKGPDKIQLAINTFKLANKYFEAAKLLLKNIDLMPVVLSNISFSCELYLKALLYGYNIGFDDIHGLKDLYNKLPEEVKDYIASNIAIDNREREFPLCLSEQNKAFVVYRYINEAKLITANPVFLFAFAHILKFVYESLTEEADASDKGEE